MIPFKQWKAVYEPLYGVLADAALYRAHQLMEGSADPETYCRLVPAGVRKLLGEYYTPDWLVEQVLDRAEYGGEAMLDPACGAGAFLVRAGAQATGWDINPLSVRMAQARCPEARVELRDAFAEPAQPFAFIAGNPPWVNWRHLGAAYRARIEPLWKEYGLFDQRGIRARLGAAMDDLCSLMTYVCADRHLVLDGRLAFLLPAALFQSAGGGSGFRRFRLPGGAFLRVVRVEELDGVQAFDGASTRPALAIFEKSRTGTIFPVAYVRGGVELDARPVSGDPASPWAIVPRGAPVSEFGGQSAYTARVGAHSGGAAGVYWVDIVEDRGPVVLVRNRWDAGRNKYAQVTAEVERELVHPLVRGRDLHDGRAVPSLSIVLPHGRDGKPIGEERMKREFPRAFAYFEHFREPMLRRAHYRRHFEGTQPYWSLYNVGPYTFAEHRVAWREQSATFQCALLEAGHIADAKLVTVAVASHEEAEYLAGFLNREDVRAFVESYVLRTQISTHVMKYLRVPTFRE